MFSNAQCVFAGIGSFFFVFFWPSIPLQDAHDSEVSALSFSSDGNYMATGGADKLVKVWSWRPSQGHWAHTLAVRHSLHTLCDAVSTLMDVCLVIFFSFLHTDKMELRATLRGCTQSIMSVQFDNSVSSRIFSSAT